MIDKLNLDWSNEGLARFWTTYGTTASVIAGAVLATLLAVLGYRIFRTEYKSKVVANIAVLFTMAWTGEGVIDTAIHKWDIPVLFAAPAFAVFEFLAFSVALKAEENRKQFGEPGLAAKMVFVVAVAQGFVASTGAAVMGLAAFRIVVPLLATGVWFVLLIAAREDDLEEWKTAREKRAEDREATWAITPRTILMRFGIMRAGKTSLTDAQRASQVDRMVELADTLAAIDPDTATGRLAKRRLNRLRRKLRTATRTANEDMVRQVAERVARADQAERLMVPARNRRRSTPDTVAGLEQQLKTPTPPTYTGPADNDAPTSPAPGGVEAKPSEVPAEWLDTHSARIALVQEVAGEAGWLNGRKPLSVVAIQEIGKNLNAAGEDSKGLANSGNARETAACLRVLRWDRRYSTITNL